MLLAYCPGPMIRFLTRLLQFLRVSQVRYLGTTVLSCWVEGLSFWMLWMQRGAESKPDRFRSGSYWQEVLRIREYGRRGQIGCGRRMFVFSCPIYYFSEYTSSRRSLFQLLAPGCCAFTSYLVLSCCFQLSFQSKFRLFQFSSVMVYLSFLAYFYFQVFNDFSYQMILLKFCYWLLRYSFSLSNSSLYLESSLFFSYTFLR